MRVPSFIWHVTTAWMLWRAHRRLRSAVPELVALDTAEREKRRQHRSGVREIAAQRKRLVTERLMREVGRVA